MDCDVELAESAARTLLAAAREWTKVTTVRCHTLLSLEGLYRFVGERVEIPGNRTRVDPIRREEILERADFESVCAVGEVLSEGGDGLRFDGGKRDGEYEDEPCTSPENFHGPQYIVWGNGGKFGVMKRLDLTELWKSSSICLDAT